LPLLDGVVCSPPAASAIDGEATVKVAVSASAQVRRVDRSWYFIVRFSTDDFSTVKDIA
jgi:hypothetical protein